MLGRNLIAAAIAACSLCIPLWALAAPAYYSPPTLLHRGVNSSPVAGKGTVVVQVFVNKNGSFTVTKVLHSTNSGDDNAALEIARRSTYRPASRGAQKLATYYDYTLRFTASGGTSAQVGGPSENPQSGAGVSRFEMMMRAGNYAAAQTGLRAYVAAHSGDTRAQADLGTVDTYLADYTGAVSAFDQAGAIAADARTAAAKAYAENAAALDKDSQYDKATASAKRAVELEPDFFTYNNLGTIESAAGDNSAAVADLQKAHSLETSTPHVTDKARLQLAENLEAVYLANKNPNDAKTAAADVARLDPGSQTAANIWANAYVSQAKALGPAKQSDAASLLEGGASTAPAVAATRLYVQAAFVYLNMQPKPDSDKAKADADKALALAPGDAQANFAEGVALANTGNSKDALTYLNKADDAAKKAADTALETSIEAALKQLQSK